MLGLVFALKYVLPEHSKMVLHLGNMLSRRPRENISKTSKLLRAFKGLVFVFPFSTLPLRKSCLYANIWWICCKYSANCSQQLFSVYSLLVTNTQRTNLVRQKSDPWMFAACHIIAAYSQQKLELFSSTRYYSPGIRYKNLVLDTVCCIFVTVTLTLYVFAECSSKELQLK